MNTQTIIKREELLSIFGVSELWAARRQLERVAIERDYKQAELGSLLSIRLKTPQGSLWFIDMYVKPIKDKLAKLEKNIYFIKRRIKDLKFKEKYPDMPIKEYRTYDVERIKQVPINKIVEVMPNGFFKNNPFRNEHSPSNSLFWFKKTNSWVDFGSGDGGDNINLYMKLNNCDFRTACRELEFI
jgi:hypothetical protein